MGSYDINVEYETLCVIEDKLNKIQYDLTESTSRMNESIQRSGEFLAGNQFEKAKETTTKCLDVSNKTLLNIKRATDFIVKLRDVLDSYGTCGYKE